MKVKKFIGKSINGFTIIDTYPVALPSGCTTRKVFLKCDDCGREFERASSVDFEHVKCKCKCKYYGRKKREYRLVKYNGETITMTELSKRTGVPAQTISSRMDRGMSLYEAIQKSFRCECKMCGRIFEDERPGKKYCSRICYNKVRKGRGWYVQPYFCECIVCKNLFCTVEKNAKTCSKECRTARDRLERSGRYKEIKARGEFDVTVTLKNVFEKYDGVCCSCGKKLTFEVNQSSNDYPSIDHITPISKGGSHTWENVQLLCRWCNSKKGARIA